jgi:hypothetical protein
MVSLTLLLLSLVAEKYTISRRRARQIASSAYLLLKEDVEEGDLNRPEMTAKNIMCARKMQCFRPCKKKTICGCCCQCKSIDEINWP